MDMGYDVGEKQCMLQSQEESQKFKVFIAVPPELVHWYKGKIMISMPTADGAISVYGGQIAGVDDKGNVLIGVDDNTAIWAGSDNGSKSLSPDDLAWFGIEDENNVPTIGFGDFAHVTSDIAFPVEPQFPMPKIPIEPQPPMPKPLIEPQPPMPKIPIEPQPPMPKPLKEPGMNDFVPGMDIEDLKSGPKRYFDTNYYNSLRDVPDDLYKNCRKVLVQLNLPDKMLEDMNYKDTQKAYEARCRSLEDYGFHEETDMSLNNELER